MGFALASLRGLTAFLGLALGITVSASSEPELPFRRDVEPWLGRFAAGADTLTFRWDDGLVADLGEITVAVDGRWHETVETFAVEHRLTWDPQRDTVTLEERHNEGAHWRYELRLVDDGRRLEKRELPGPDGDGGTLVRVYRRLSED